MHRRRYLQLATGAVGTAAATGLPRRVRAQQSPDGTLTQQAKLSAADGDSLDGFGYSVDVSGDASTAVVGAQQDDDPNGNSAGSVYVFERAGGSWSQQTKLAPADGDERERFGRSVAVSEDGSTVIVGSYWDDNPNGSNAGSAYVFVFSGGSWSQQAKLTATDGDDDDELGQSVTVSSDGATAVVGAPDDEDPNGYDSGSAYVFVFSGGSWSQQAKLTATDGDDDDGFGYSVAVSGDGSTAVVGAYEDEDPNDYRSGSAYVFERSGDTWSQQTKLTATDGERGDLFGYSIGLSREGSTAIVGAYKDDAPNNEYSGSAYVFAQSGGSWGQQAKLVSPDAGPTGAFGFSVGLSGDGSTAIVGDRRAEQPNGEDSGSAYVFSRAGGAWEEEEQTRLAAADGDSSDWFGYSVSLSEEGSTAVVGAFRDEDPNGRASGSAYVFERTASAGDLPTEDPSFQDVLGVIEAYNDGTTYAGVEVGFGDVLAVIEAYNAG